MTNSIRLARPVLAITLFSLLVSPNLIATTAYQVIESEYLKTFTPSSEQTTNTALADLEQNKQSKTFTPKSLDTYEQHALAIALLKNNGTQTPLTVIDNKFIKKMELLCGGGSPENNLLSQINYTQTLFGELALAKLLINPTKSARTIQQRQAVIRDLVSIENQNDLDGIFASMQGLESSILSYWQTQDPAATQMYDRLYFGSYLSFLNKSTLGLECKTRLRNLGTLIFTTLPVLPGMAFTIYQNGKETRPAHLAKVVTDFGKSYYPYKLAYKDKSVAQVSAMLTQGEAPVSFGDGLVAVDALMVGEQQQNVKATKLLTGGAKAAMTVYYIWAAKNAIQDAQLNTSITNHIHQRLIDLATYINQTKKVHAILEQLETVREMPAFDVLTNYFDGTAPISANAQQLLNMLDHRTFSGSPSIFTLTGRVLAAHKLMEEVKDELAPLFEAAGELEAYVSVAQLVKKHQDTPVHFCFAELMTSDTPYVQMTNFWNPFINPDEVVPNNIVLNGSEPRNAIVTGPNTGGKSTIIKSVGLNLLFAQTFGIAAADSMRFTPFTALNCHLNITDDIATGTSLFHAEVKRAKELLDQVQALKPHEFSFTILDEVFNGTNAEGGSKAAYRFAHDLGTHKNALLIIATHFNLMTDLQRATDYFKNVSVWAQVKEDGTIYRPFTLRNGTFEDPENKILEAILQQEGIFAQPAA